MASLNSVPIMGESYDIMSSLLFMMNLQVRHVKMETRKRINTNHQVDHPKLGLKTKGTEDWAKTTQRKRFNSYLADFFSFSSSFLMSLAAWFWRGRGGVLFKNSRWNGSTVFFTPSSHLNLCHEGIQGVILTV